MQEIRGPDFPDSVPDHLVAVYGAHARQTVRYRRSWRFRLARRVGRLIGHRDPWYLAAAGLLWLVIVTAFGASVALASIRWPGAMLEGAVVLFVAVCSSLVTAIVVRRRARRT
jgi:hypothetical protein